MAILDTLLFGFVALLLGLKVALLAAATMLLVFGITKRLRRQNTRPRLANPRAHRLDVHA